MQRDFREREVAVPGGGTARIRDGCGLFSRETRYSQAMAETVFMTEGRKVKLRRPRTRLRVP